MTRPGPRILVVGSANIDHIMQVQRMPAPGETVTGGRYLQVFGGKGANQAVAAARAGGAVTLLTCVGDEPQARQMLHAYADDGIDTSRAIVRPDLATGAAMIVVDASGENSIAVAPGANDALGPEVVESAADLFDPADAVLLNMELPPATVTAAIRLAGERGRPVVLNYAPVRGAPVALSDAVTTLVVNEQEAAALVGLAVEREDDALAAATRLRQRGPDIVVVTLGSRGLVAATGEGVLTLPAFDVRPVDTTAAGDTFCGALTVAQAERQPMLDALRFASAAAAICVTTLGAQPSIPRRPAIEAMLVR